jgi:hypothetical protein
LAENLHGGRVVGRRDFAPLDFLDLMLPQHPGTKRGFNERPDVDFEVRFHNRGDFRLAPVEGREAESVAHCLMAGVVRAKAGDRGGDALGVELVLHGVGGVEVVGRLARERLHRGLDSKAGDESGHANPALPVGRLVPFLVRRGSHFGHVVTDLTEVRLQGFPGEAGAE